LVGNQRRQQGHVIQLNPRIVVFFSQEKVGFSSPAMELLVISQFHRLCLLRCHCHNCVDIRVGNVGTEVCTYDKKGRFARGNIFGQTKDTGKIWSANHVVAILFGETNIISSRGLNCQLLSQLHGMSIVVCIGDIWQSDYLVLGRLHDCKLPIFC
jgi:hypothetical protein